MLSYAGNHCLYGSLGQRVNGLSLPPSSLPPMRGCSARGIKGDGRGDEQGREDEENMTLGSGFLPSGQTRNRVLASVRVAWSPGFV